MTIHRILLATDLSPHADRAMERAVQLAGQFGAEIAAVCAVEGEEASARLGSVSQEIERHFSAIPAAKRLSPLPVATSGAVDEAIAVLMAEWRPDLLVMGAHRIDGLGDLFAVTTIEKVALRCDVPILVVRNRAFHRYRSLMVAVDYEPPSRIALERGLGLLPDGSVHLVNAADLPAGAAVRDPVSVSPDALPEELEQFVAGMDFGDRLLSWSVHPGRPQSEIVAAAHDLRPDLLALGTSGRSGLGRMVMGSVAHDVLQHLPCDALLCRL